MKPLMNGGSFAFLFRCMLSPLPVASLLNSYYAPVLIVAFLFGLNFIKKTNNQLSERLLSPLANTNSCLMKP